MFLVVLYLPAEFGHLDSERGRELVEELRSQGVASVSSGVGQLCFGGGFGLFMTLPDVEASVAFLTWVHSELSPFGKPTTWNLWAYTTIDSLFA